MSKLEGDPETLRTCESLSRALSELVSKRSAELEVIGFSSEMARFDSVQMMKMLVDGFYDELNEGAARHEWYREFLGISVRRNNSLRPTA